MKIVVALGLIAGGFVFGGGPVVALVMASVSPTWAVVVLILEALSW
ncbi:hypothetical protein [Thalassobius vesicularis]|nr:hypothetical protein [Thalassobius vesicularis]